MSEHNLTSRGEAAEPYPDDGGLRPQVRPYEDTPSAFAVMKEHFFPEATDHHHEAGGAPGREEDHYPSHEALCDLVSLLSEHDALNGGGPGWSERWKTAVINAEEIVRVEP